MEQNKDIYTKLKTSIKLIVSLLVMMTVVIIGVVCMIIFEPEINSRYAKAEQQKTVEAIKKAKFEKWKIENNRKKEALSFWTPKELNTKATDSLTAMVKYGKELISHTARYLGPKGRVMKTTNGMNCQNCHLEAGTKAWGNNYGAVFSTYPKYRARSGTEEDIYKRINDCLERSLNGKALANSSKEMQAIKAYIEYVGADVKKGDKPKGSGLFELPFLDRPADPKKGQILYAAKCQSCHQENGQGLLAADQKEYTYPPLWGKNSYNYGAGLYRLSRFAGYVKYNMPQGATYLNPQLTDEESWDLAAFVNTQPRPPKDLSKDWPKIDEKPVDHPFGPFADKFPESQHKFGPFKAIKEAQKKMKKLKEKSINQTSTK